MHKLVSGLENIPVACAMIVAFRIRFPNKKSCGWTYFGAGWEVHSTADGNPNSGETVQEFRLVKAQPSVSFRHYNLLRLPSTECGVARKSPDGVPLKRLNPPAIGPAQRAFTCHDPSCYGHKGGRRWAIMPPVGSDTCPPP